MKRCKNCDSQVTERFGRVYGNENGEVYRCIHCVESRSVLRHGGGAIRDMEKVEKRIHARQQK